MKLIKIFIVLLFFAAMILGNSYAVTIDRTEIVGSFTVTVLNNDDPIREIDGVAVIPFDTEYELLLKNNNDRRAVAKVTIDGANISAFGDIVIPARGKVNLERFITDSLDKGDRFRFVPLDHPEVDDPSREENGLIRVEFQLEKKRQFIQWGDGSRLYLPYPDWEDDGNWMFLDTRVPCSDDVSIWLTNTAASATAEPGATIGGSESDQRFSKINIDLEDEVWIIKIILKGVKQ